MTKVPKKTPYLVTKGGRHYFRIAVPKELQQAVGKKEVSLALGDLNKAQAEIEAARNGVHWQARFLRERHALGLAPLPPAPQSTQPASRIATTEEIHALALLSQRVMLEADEEGRIEGTLGMAAWGPGHDPATAVPKAVSGRDLEGVAMQAEDHLWAHGLDLPSDPIERRRALYVFAKAMTVALKGKRLRDEGEAVDTPALAPFPPRSTPQKRHHCLPPRSRQRPSSSAMSSSCGATKPRSPQPSPYLLRGAW